MARQQGDGPALPLYLTEPGRAMAEFGMYLAARPLESHLPKGDGHPVLVLPGLLADDSSTRVLRAVLRRLGYRVHGWGLGRNIGPTAVCVNGLRDKLDYLHGRYRRKVTVIGWSLGGIFARDLARACPDKVRSVITLGSPFRIERHTQTWASKAFDRYAHLHVEQRPFPLEADGCPLPVPATSIYSHFDGIVHWQTCLDVPGEQCENIAVQASHLGIGHHPAAIWAVADRLAQPEGEWTPFKAPTFLRPVFPRPATPARPAAAVAPTAAPAPVTLSARPAA